MNNAMELTSQQKKVLLRRWKSIKENAERNMSYGGGGTYSSQRTDRNGDYLALPSLAKDRATLPLIDELITEILK